jgi:hypothetical protein
MTPGRGGTAPKAPPSSASRRSGTPSPRAKCLEESLRDSFLTPNGTCGADGGPGAHYRENPRARQELAEANARKNGDPKELV